jgi:hypothetical protein
VYDSGYQFTKLDGFTERQLPLRFIAYEEPYFYEIGDVATTLTTISSGLEWGGIIKKGGNGVWEDLSYTKPTSGQVNVIASNSDYIYIGGSFTNWDDDSSMDYLARYNKSSGVWDKPYSTAPLGSILDMKFSPDGDLYITGGFTSVDGVSNTAYIAKYDGTNWSALGTGLSGGVGYALEFDYSGNLYIGGTFTTAGGSSHTRLVIWDGTSYQDWADANAGVYTIELAKSGSLIIGGAFTTINGNGSYKYIAEYNATDGWSYYGTSPNDDVWSVYCDNNGVVYLAGTFTTAGGVTVNGVAKWTGGQFISLGDGITDSGSWGVYEITGHNGDVYIGGSFDSVGNLSVNDSVAVWNGSTWTHLDCDLYGNNPDIQAIHFDDDDLYIGGVGWGALGGTSYASYRQTITNSGSRTAYPKLVISRSGGDGARALLFKNETIDKSLYLDYELLDGETLTIDLQPGKRSVNSSYFGSVFQAILRNSNIGDFCLYPGNNDISAFITEDNSPDVSCHLIWRNTHWSADGVAV